MRVDEERFEINNLKQTVLRNHYVITILNENGERWAEFGEYYDKHQGRLNLLKEYYMMPAESN